LFLMNSLRLLFKTCTTEVLFYGLFCPPPQCAEKPYVSTWGQEPFDKKGNQARHVT
jgi:hypothetical protein